jgi:hypothetical protein
MMLSPKLGALNMRKLTLLLSCLLLAMIAGCSSEQKATSSTSATSTAKPAPEAPEYITGRAAFQKLFVSARSFAPDIKPFRLQSNYLPDAPTSEGKAGIWRGYFASPSKSEAKSYTWSGVSGENFPDRGVSHGTEDTWNPSNSSAQVWELAYLKIDSDKAYELAQKHGGDKLTKKDPKQPVSFMLDWNKQDSKLLWHVVYGTNANDAKLRIAVDASSGEFVRNEH